jgi:hypothetical protein
VVVVVVLVLAGLLLQFTLIKFFAAQVLQTQLFGQTLVTAVMVVMAQAVTQVVGVVVQAVGAVGFILFIMNFKASLQLQAH